METNREYINCDCGLHAISIESDKDIQEIFICMWQQGKYQVRTLKEKIRFIYYTLKQGYPWADQICLNLEESKKLRDILTKHIRRLK